MKEYNVTLYYSTMFGGANIPSSPAVLETVVSKTTFPAVYLRQDASLAVIKLKAEWEQVENADYARVGDKYYFVIGVNMTTPETAHVMLQMDYFTSAGGIDNITFLSGWCKRSHTGMNDLFGNTLDEPWMPSRDMVLEEPYYIIQDEDGGVQYTIVGSTVDLLQQERVAEVYESIATDLDSAVTVPKISAIEEGTLCRMEIPDGLNGTIKDNKLPNCRLYNFAMLEVKDGVQAMRSLGIDNAITACYTIPLGFLAYTIPAGGTNYSEITIRMRKHEASTLPYKYATPGFTIRNTKVFNLYNQYQLLSICSGDGLDFEASQIYKSGDLWPDFTVFADPSPNGCPYIQPDYFEGRPNRPFSQCVQGMPWQNTPLSFSEKSGYLVDNQQFQRRAINPVNSYKQMVTNNTIRSVTGALDLVFGGSQNNSDEGGNGLSLPSATGVANWGLGVYNNAKNEAAALQNLSNMRYDFNVAQNIRIPEIAFPRDESIQVYVGNGFCVVQRHLHPSDAKKLDLFLTQFGCTQDKKLEKQDFVNNQYFNFVQATGVNISSPVGLRYRQGIISQLEEGVRLWHVLPNYDAMEYNPERGS